MTKASKGILRVPRRRILALCAGASFAISATATASTLLVTSCADDNSAGTLRSQVAAAGTGDTIDLSQLTCSKITLTNGQVVIAQNDLTLLGAMQAATIRLDAIHGSRVLQHLGTGTVTIDSLTLMNGSYATYGFATGGCVFSEGNVSLDHSVVTGCEVHTKGNCIDDAAGGGIYAKSSVSLVASVVSNNQAKSSNGVHNFGGGIFAGDGFTARNSTISHNDAPFGCEYGRGGGIVGSGPLLIESSTIDDNSAMYAGGMSFRATTGLITNSTMSSNTGWSAMVELSGDAVTIANSTIAATPGSMWGLFFSGRAPSSGQLTLQSNILSGSAFDDLRINASYTTLVGTDNLVMQTTVAAPPPGMITVTADPLLGPLQNNGGPTLTHALLPGSPAIGAGNNSAVLMFDQRGAGYPRSANSGITDIGAFQTEGIFADDFERVGFDFDKIFVDGFE